MSLRLPYDLKNSSSCQLIVECDLARTAGIKVKAVVHIGPCLGKFTDKLISCLSIRWWLDRLLNQDTWRVASIRRQPRCRGEPARLHIAIIPSLPLERRFSLLDT